MKFKELFQDVEDWFWKLEFNPETSSYELYLGIPNDWVFSEKNGLIKIELLHELEDNSIIKIYAEDVESDVSIDDIIDISKLLISKNQELEKRKESHRSEMENLKLQLIEKEERFLEYVDQVKDNTLTEGINNAVFDAVRTVVNKLTPVDGVSEGVNDGVSEGVNFNKGKDFIEDIEKLKLS